MSVVHKAARIVTTLADQAANSALDPVVRRQLATANIEEPRQFPCAVYFSDPPAALYQVRQWLQPLARLAQRFPVAVMAHHTLAAAQLARESPLPVYLTRGIGQTEEFLDSHGVRIVFYVNNSQPNFTVLRQTGRVHIHLNHGESEKISMVSNQLKAYDFVFIAGEASRRRILSAVERLGDDRLVPIGRPQLDDAAATDQDGQNGQVTVLYAPTWEGDRPAMRYGSLTSHGSGIAGSLLADARYRLIFRPHPLTGSRMPEHGRMVKRIQALIREANKRSPSANHVFDTGPDCSRSMAQADFCVCDISAVAFDWLPRMKPMLVTWPTDAKADVSPDGITAAVPLLPAHAVDKTAATITELLGQPIPAGQATLVQHHFGDVSPGSATRRFIGAVDRLLS